MAKVTAADPVAEPAQRKCLAVRADGQPCRSRAAGSGYCSFHDPALASKVKSGRKLGCCVVHRRPAAPVIPDGAKPADWLTALVFITNLHLAKGDDARSAGVICRAVAGALTLYTTTELEQRVQRLEAAAEGSQP